jgi:hypothetical protein
VSSIAFVDLATISLSVNRYLFRSKNYEESNIVNVTSQSAALAEEQLASLGYLDRPINDFTVNQAIADSNSQIADLFAINGDLTAFDIVA